MNTNSNNGKSAKSAKSMRSTRSSTSSASMRSTRSSASNSSGEAYVPRFINITNNNDYHLIEYLKEPKKYYKEKTPSNLALKTIFERKLYSAACSLKKKKYSAREWQSKRAVYVQEIGRTIARKNREAAINELDRLHERGCSMKRGRSRSPERSGGSIKRNRTRK